MYKFLYVFILLCSTSLFSQSLDGFMGIKFGSSPEMVKKAMLSKPGAKFDSKYSSKYFLCFKGLTFAGREVLMIGFSFFNNKFHTGTVLIQPRLESQVVDTYTKIKDEINQKYYVTDMDFENYRYPYEKGDGLTETAIELGKADFSAYWKFKNNIAPEEDYIGLEITERLFIKIRYQNGALNKPASDKQKEEKNADY